MTTTSDRDLVVTPDPVGPAVSLEQLLSRCADQDQTAFAEYYRRTSPSLNALLARRGSSAVRAESALVSTYVSVWRQSAEFVSGDHASAWGWTLGWLNRALRETAERA